MTQALTALYRVVLALTEDLLDGRRLGCIKWEPDVSAGMANGVPFARTRS